jgi:hypothetical protein
MRWGLLAIRIERPYDTPPLPGRNLEHSLDGATGASAVERCHARRREPR